MVRDGVSITKSANSVILTKDLTLSVINTITMSPVCLVAHCIGSVAIIGTAVLRPGLLTVGLAVHAITKK